ncbi:phosphatidylglycerophosphatase A family protein [Paucibacter sp. M5-1]|uniref:phosphatidylglycerophosphatase A family protein n=1 Tax=Paucibacter sp. M5-1 TaxID=3015998 RepID=UPI0022B8EC00|nr:phosphatidylglycerophosphatase A [Paucibacter sp. M5-1]MCZ7881510.1 phosphatidylglycerophosphatase A [Paucibacter sp. M5-1]
MTPDDEASSTAPRRATARFMWGHPARWIALGFGSGLSPKAPGTVGTLWAWVAFLALDPWLGDLQWGLTIGIGTLIGWWACTLTARHLNTPDPGAIVWDEVLAFWLVLWLAMPMGLWGQALAFGLFRFFDAAKPGPVGWADRLFKGERGKPVGYAQGFGILFDDFVAAGCTLLVIALWRALVG